MEAYNSLSRALLQQEGDQPDTGEQQIDDTTPLRVASIFVILSAGLLGGIPPLFLQVFRDPDSTTTRLVRSFSAGVIVALALVHIVPEAVTEMEGLGGIEYPLGGTCVLFGIVLMVGLEHFSHVCHSTAEAAGLGGARCRPAGSGGGQSHSRGGGGGKGAQHGSHGGSSSGDAKLAVYGIISGGGGSSRRSRDAGRAPTQAGATGAAACGGAAAPCEEEGERDVEAVLSAGAHSDSEAQQQQQQQQQQQGGCGSPTAAAPDAAAHCPGGGALTQLALSHGESGLSGDDCGSGAGTGGGGGGGGHSHVCVSRGPASNWVTATEVEAAAVGSVRQRVVAYLFELGCIFHSFIIGLSLGVNQTDITEVRSLLIALAFHQWLEGLSLASVVLRGGFSSLKGVAMVVAYSLTCPVGIAVGMAIAATYDPESERARGLQGAFNGVSGGMLLYIALVQLVAEDMGRLVAGRDSAAARLGCFGGLCGGAAAMCLLALWA